MIVFSLTDDGDDIGNSIGSQTNHGIPDGGNFLQPAVKGRVRQRGGCRPVRDGDSGGDQGKE